MPLGNGTFDDRRWKVLQARCTERDGNGVGVSEAERKLFEHTVVKLMPKRNDCRGGGQRCLTPPS